MNATQSVQTGIKAVVIVELSLWAMCTLFTFLMLLRLLIVLHGSKCRQQLEPNFRKLLANIVVVQSIGSSAQLFYVIPYQFLYDQASLIKAIFNIRTRIIVLAFIFKTVLNLVVACNRYTAMAFPIIQKSLWTSTRLNKLLMILWEIFPFLYLYSGASFQFVDDSICIIAVFFVCPILTLTPSMLIYCRIVCILYKTKSKHSKNMIQTIAATVATSLGKYQCYFIK
ncbi:hypothetical protein PFISCL1PPCAC_4494, partial [Pristionchus fissidentatus]